MPGMGGKSDNRQFVHKRLSDLKYLFLRPTNISQPLTLSKSPKPSMLYYLKSDE
jgi:hypothetical protein